MGEIPISHSERSEAYAAEPVMTLRDWFAGQAMQGILANNPTVNERLIGFFGKPGMDRYTVCATVAYLVADDMIEARKVKP